MTTLTTLTPTVTIQTGGGETGQSSYPIYIGTGLIERAAELITPLLNQPRVFVLTDDTVAGLHLPALLAGFTANNITAHVIRVPAAEASKSFELLERVCAELLEARLERSDTLIALGGGVIGDLGGFAAAIALRGIKFIGIPTTLLAQVDSSIGGKTGINTARGKNLIGAFYNPAMVIADTGSLLTLSAREMRSGYAEVVKYGALGDREFFDWLCANVGSILGHDEAAVSKAVAHCCRQKGDIVENDPREAGRRALLNLGHTFAHAFEALAGYDGRLTHGEAVAAGMVEAAELSASLGYCSASDAARVESHLREAGLPTGVKEIADRIIGTDGVQSLPSRLVSAMTSDKKAHGGKIGLVLLRSIGDAFTSWDVDTSTLEDHLRLRLQA